MKLFTKLLIIVITFVPSFAQAPLAPHHRELIKAWNTLGESLEKENLALVELDKSFQLNPPWRVLDAREPAKRAALIDTIVAEHKRRLKLLETIKAEDSK